MTKARKKPTAETLTIHSQGVTIIYNQDDWETMDIEENPDGSFRLTVFGEDEKEVGNFSAVNWWKSEFK